MNNKLEPQTNSLNKYLSELKVTSKVYAWTVNDISYVKVDFPELGMYINSITIRPNPRDLESLWVQMPKFRTGGPKWIEPLEFRGDSFFREIIIRNALKAYFEYHDGDFTNQGLEKFIKENFP